MHLKLRDRGDSSSRELQFGAAGFYAALIIAALLFSVCEPRWADAGECRTLRYSFQTASRPPEALPPGALELPPQIAVWIETADGAFIDTLMVTTGVALRGIGNRPGQVELPSGPKFPYGRRPMALPVWAHARGHLYPSVVMVDGDETDLGGHEESSSPEPYFCRPMLPSEVVDAITCPSGSFRSVKGIFAGDGSMTYYPPRGDNKEGWDNIDIFGWLGYPMQIKVDFLCRDSILAAPLVLDLVLFLDLAQRSSELRGLGIQEWLSFYFKSPMTAPGLYPEHDLFIQLMKLKNTLRHLKGEDLITHLGLEYYD